jgi:hypothetical protein
MRTTVALISHVPALQVEEGLSVGAGHVAAGERFADAAAGGEHQIDEVGEVEAGGVVGGWWQCSRIGAESVGEPVRFVGRQRPR